MKALARAAIFPSSPSDVPLPPFALGGAGEVAAAATFASGNRDARATDPDLDPSAAMLLRVGPAGCELRLGQSGLEFLSPGSFAGRAGVSDFQTAPSPGEGKTQLNHYRRGN